MPVRAAIKDGGAGGIPGRMGTARAANDFWL